MPPVSIPLRYPGLSSKKRYFRHSLPISRKRSSTGMYGDEGRKDRVETDCQQDKKTDSKPFSRAVEERKNHKDQSRIVWKREERLDITLEPPVAILVEQVK